VARIREARPADALAVAGVHVRAWQRAYSGLIDDEFLAELSVEERAAGYRFGELEPGGPEAILAVEDGAAVGEASGDEGILGFATFGPCRDADGAGTGEIYALYVEPERWRGGAGRLLLGEACRRLRKRGYEEAVLWVLLGNAMAERFYEADGWERDGAERIEQPYGVISRVRRFRRRLS
jgi:GNAT superfamily N-acetyltransferase